MNSDQYETSDFGLATAILTSGFQLRGVNRDNPRRVVFVFEFSNELVVCANQYWTGELQLPVNSILGSIKHLKALIYE